MAYKIRWTLNALADYERVINYLVMDRSLNIAIDFEAILNKNKQSFLQPVYWNSITKETYCQKYFNYKT